MFTKLSDLQKAAVFTVLVLVLAVMAALSIKALGLTSLLWAMVWSSTPVLATVIMLSTPGFFHPVETARHPGESRDQSINPPSFSCGGPRSLPNGNTPRRCQRYPRVIRASLQAITC